MDFIKDSKDALNAIEDKVEKSWEVAKDKLGNIVSYLPFANMAKHSPNTIDIEIDLPGVKKEDISLTVEDNVLTLSATRKMKHEAKEEDYYLCESSFGLISRSFVIPNNIDKDKINAQYEDGILYITFEKEESKKARNISIK
ncbi:MAG: Hsp20/alpha crystallin family protein [Sulfurospirillaceae bacterium]|nr:Hsp20/alpha crystallin family protein [Sulfurospirillaceae bacterium]